MGDPERPLWTLRSFSGRILVCWIEETPDTYRLVVLDSESRAPRTTEFADMASAARVALDIAAGYRERGWIDDEAGSAT